MTTFHLLTQLFLGVTHDQFELQFSSVTRLFENLVTRGGATRAEAYDILVRRFPEAIRVG